ncbi:MAG: DHA2 family efflux MFS transporter permease subunit, partial [Actinomycetota bacterium]|nr:DHA2 family efflux MFS transporter permease subunit [Actinomycetota bacterium]
FLHHAAALLPSGPVTEMSSARRRLGMTALLIAAAFMAADITITNVALPTIAAELAAPMSSLQWVVDSYNITVAGLLLLGAGLGERYSRKGTFLAGISLFLAGSALSGAAGEPWLDSIFTSMTGEPRQMFQLILFRGIQGIGGGAMMANGMAIIGDLFEARERARYQGLMGAVFGLASVLGPPLGGWLTDTASWRWIFYINIPIGIVALAVLAVTMPRPEPGQQHRVDWWGAAALTAGLVPLLLALNWGGSVYAWNSPTVLGLLGFAALALFAFVVRELRASEPILDVTLFRDRSFTASMTVLFLSGVGMFGSIMFLPTFMQIVQGRSASGSGSLLMPMLIAMIGSSILTGQLIARTGRYKVFGLVGMGVAAVGMFLLSQLSAETTNLMLAFDMVCVGVGIGATMPLFTISLQSQHPTRMGEVTGALQFFRSIGGTVGVALLGGVMNAAFARELGVLLTEQSARFGDAFPLLSKLAEEPGKLLNAGAMERLASTLPAAARPLLQPFFEDVRVALTVGIAEAFLWGSVLMALAFVAMWFVREIPLFAKPHLETPAEIGSELLAEEAVQPSEHEPCAMGECDDDD